MFSINSTLSAGDLIHRAQGTGSGAQAAKGLLFSTYQPLLIKHTLTAPVPLREDAYQAASEGFLRAIIACDPERAVTFGALAMRYVKGAVLKEIIFHLSEPNYIEDADIPGGPDADTDPPDDGGDTGLTGISAEDEALQRVEISDVAVKVRAFVRGLSEVQQRVVVAVYWRDHSQADVARELGVSRAAVSKTVARVLSKAREEVMFSFN